MRNQRLLRQLKRHIPPPVMPDAVRGKVLHESFGPSLRLPDDYRLFLDVYGPGSFTEASQNIPGGYPAFEVFDLVSPAEMNLKSGDKWENKVQLLLQYLQESREMYPEMYPAAYPEVPGLLPWADFDQGYTFCWWVDGPPNSWRVVVDDRSEMIRYDYSMLEFLAVNLTEMPGEKFFDDGVERFEGFMSLSQRRDYLRSFFNGNEP